jgi:hypothetical protein
MSKDAYGFIIERKKDAVFVFQVQDVRKTEKILSTRGLFHSFRRGALPPLTGEKGFSFYPVSVHYKRQSRATSARCARSTACVRRWMWSMEQGTRPRAFAEIR